MSKVVNWWDDPKNQEEVKRISWWNHPENKETTSLPISVIEDGGMWVVAPNDDTKALVGDLGQSAQGDTKEEAVKQFFEIIRISHEWETEERLSYQRWVPFRKGPWGKTGGNWFSVFGIHVYFRHGSGMKGGQYIPLTKLNVSVSSDWAIYKNWKQRNKH